MSRTSKTAWIVSGLALLGLLLVPLSNLISARTLLTVEGGPGPWAKVSPILQRKCVDCHAQEFALLPWYAHLPLIGRLIQYDQQQGAAGWHMTREEITGRSPLDEAALAALEWKVGGGDMPPPQYWLLHWSSRLTSGDRSMIGEHITAVRSTSPEAQQMAASRRGEPLQILLAPSNLDPRRVELGRLLFHDRRLSGDGTVACASCHALNRGGSDQARVSTGIRGQKGNINDPSVFNASYNIRQFWDGRAKDLNEQAGGPVENPIEMGARFPAVIAQLTAVDDYRQRFLGLFAAEGISRRTITDAIAEFEKSLVTVGSRFDRYLRGDDAAISQEEKLGYARFKSAGCSACHFGPAVGGRTFEKLGVVRDYFAARGHVSEPDYGRFNVTHLEEDRYRFKVPILRNVAVTHPYLHDASAQNLQQAVTVMARYQLEDGPNDQEIGWIVKFLESLTGTYQGKPVDKL
jgi:cytochrome c peroxidase